MKNAFVARTNGFSSPTLWIQDPLRKWAAGHSLMYKFIGSKHLLRRYVDPPKAKNQGPSNGEGLAKAPSLCEKQGQNHPFQQRVKDACREVYV